MSYKKNTQEKFKVYKLNHKNSKASVQPVPLA